MASVAINYRKEYNKMNRKFQSIRYSMTGVFGYEFIDEQGQRIGGASTIVAPNQPVYIEGFGYKFVSKVNENGYVCIEDSENRIIAYVECLGQNRYSMHFYDLMLCVEVDAMSYKFLHNDKLVILMNRDTREKRFHIDVFEELTDAIGLIAFAVPALLAI